MNASVHLHLSTYVAREDPAERRGDDGLPLLDGEMAQRESKEEDVTAGDRGADVGAEVLEGGHPFKRLDLDEGEVDASFSDRVNLGAIARRIPGEDHVELNHLIDDLGLRQALEELRVRRRDDVRVRQDPAVRVDAESRARGVDAELLADLFIVRPDGSA